MFLLFSLNLSSGQSHVRITPTLFNLKLRQIKELGWEYCCTKLEDNVEKFSKVYILFFYAQRIFGPSRKIALEIT